MSTSTGIIGGTTFDEGSSALYRTTEQDGVFCYTFFKAIGTKEVIVANCATISHSTSEIERLPHDDPSIPYDWGILHK